MNKIINIPMIKSKIHNLGKVSSDSNVIRKDTFQETVRIIQKRI